MREIKCRNCGQLWTEHSSDRWGPYCIRVYRPEIPPDDATPRWNSPLRPWLATLTQRQMTLITRIAEAAVIAVVVSLLLAILNIKSK